MPKSTIRIRYKHSDMALGDMASFNAHNQVGGWPAPKYAGYEEEIPATILDDKHKSVLYKNPNGTTEFISKREVRKRQHSFGGYTAHSAYHTPAPPPNPGNANSQKLLIPARQMDPAETEEFMRKQEIGSHYLAEFNPICMELVDDLPEEVMALAKKEHPEWFERDEQPKAQVLKPSGKTPDLTKLQPGEAVKIIGEAKDPDVLRAYRDQEAKLGAPRPMVLTAIEGKIRELMSQG